MLADEIAKWPDGSAEAIALTALMEEFFGATAPEGMSRNGLNWLAVPKDVPAIPEWARGLIDRESVLQANAAPIYPILEAIGVRVVRLPAPESYSNVIRF